MSTIFRISIWTLLSISALSQLNAQWVRQNSGTESNLTDVVMLDNITAIVVGKSGAILRTTDAGATWVDVTLPLSYIGYWNALSFYDSASGFAVGDQSAIFWTLNGGAGWMWNYLPALRTCYSVLCTGHGACSVGTDSGWVFTTSDTGRTWQSEKISDWSVRSIFQWRGEPLVGVSKYAITAHSFCTQYVVPPPSWGEENLPAFEQLGSEAYDAEFAQNGGPVYVVGGHGDYYSEPVVLKKSLSDTTWQDVSPNASVSGIFTGVSAPTASVVYVCGSGGIMYKSTDAGTTWGKQDVPTKLNINAIYFFDETHGFAVGDSGLILYTQTGGLLRVDDHGVSVPEKFELFQNYPNPFNPVTMIVYRLPVNSRVTLRVCDVLGRHVRTLVDDEVRKTGRYEVRFDASDLPSGVYFCRLFVSSVDGGKLEYTSARKIAFIK